MFEYGLRCTRDKRKERPEMEEVFLKLKSSLISWQLQKHYDSINGPLGGAHGPSIGVAGRSSLGGAETQTKGGADGPSIGGVERQTMGGADNRNQDPTVNRYKSKK